MCLLGQGDDRVFIEGVLSVTVLSRAGEGGSIVRVCRHHSEGVLGGRGGVA